MARPKTVKEAQIEQQWVSELPAELRDHKTNMDILLLELTQGASDRDERITFESVIAWAMIHRVKAYLCLGDTSSVSECVHAWHNVIRMLMFSRRHSRAVYDYMDYLRNHVSGPMYDLLDVTHDVLKSELPAPLLGGWCWHISPPGFGVL